MHPCLPAQKVTMACAHACRRVLLSLIAFAALGVVVTGSAYAAVSTHGTPVPRRPRLLAPAVRVTRLAPAGSVVPHATLAAAPKPPARPKRAATARRASAVRADSAFASSGLAWGNDAYGQLGDGTSSQSVPTPQGISLPAGTALTQTSAGDDHSLAVASDGTIWAWGSDAQGQLGDGGSSQNSAPVHISLPGGAKAAQVVAGSMYSLVVTTAGQVYAWGQNSTGQLGDGNTNGSSTPVQVNLPSGVTITQVAAGQGTGYALTSSGQIYAWGDDTDGQIGNGTTSTTPVTSATLVSLPSGDTVEQIAAEGYFAEALAQGGSVVAWGSGLGGTLGTGSAASSNSPVQVSLPAGANVTQIAAGPSFSLALTSGGGVLAWGAGSKGQIGNGSTGEADTPVPVSLPAGVAASQVAAGGSFAIAVTHDGQAYSWGDDSLGQLGNGSSGGQSDTPVPVNLPAGTTLAQVSAGLFHALGILAPTIALASPDIAPTSGGTPVTITGTGFAGVTAVKFGGAPAQSFTVTSANAITAKAPAEASGATAITLTGPFGTTSRSTADRFGYVGASTPVDWGQGAALGAGNVNDSSVPVLPVLPAGVTVSALSATSDTSLALTTTGTVYEWGGLPETDTPVPVSFPSGTVITQIAAESYGALALSSTGKVYAWGYNGDGELGNGTTTGSTTPVQVSLPSTFTATAIAGEGVSGLALGSDGSLYAWGDNAFGDLGDGTTTTRLTPVPVSLPSGVTAKAIAGEDFTGLALASNGQLLAWGYNADGELGNGSTTNTTVPVAVSLPANTTIQSIAGEAFDGLALTGAGKVLAWGQGSLGQLGNGSTQGSDVPVSVSLPAGTTVTSLGSEYFDGIALTSNGTVESWGSNASGELGNGTTTESDTPVTPAIPGGLAATAVTRGLGFGGLAVVGTPPVVTGLASSLGPVTGGATVTISGANLIGVSAVRFGSTAATSFKVISSSLINAVVPAGSGTVDVTLTGPGGTSSKRAADRFTYVSSGATLAWGEGDNGQLGNGGFNLVNKLPVVPALPAGAPAAQVANGVYSSYALTASGQVYAWGDNTHAELGTGATGGLATTPTHVRLPAGVKISQIAAGCYGAWALTSTGQVYAWGYGSDGEAGNGTVAAAVATPVLVALPTGVKVTQLAGACQGAYALGSTGQVYGWGYGGDGELGNGSLAASSVPVTVSLPAGTAVASIAAEGYDGLVLTADGRLLAWGYNYNGEVGNGQTQNNITTPVQVATPGAVTGIGAEGFDGLAITTGGKLYAWGWGPNGQLGNGTATDSGTPSAVSLPAGTTVTSVGGGYESAYALTSSGRLYSWGDNSFGELGDAGTEGHSVVPTAVKIPAGLVPTSLATGTGYQELATVRVPTSAAAALFASNATNNSITSYAGNASGNATPVTTIVGPATELATPAGITVDGTGTVLAADSASNAITEYPAGSTGNVSPSTTLVGPATALAGPQGVAVDPSGKLLVANATGNSITEYPAGASGDVAPIVTISGSATGLNSPHQVVLDASGNLWVADRNANAILEFAKGATGNVAPIDRIAGSTTGLMGPSGLAFDAAGKLRVTDQNSSALATFAAAAKGNVGPVATLTGAATALHSPVGVAVGASAIAVADSSTSTVTLYNPTATGNTPPVGTVSGAATGLSGTDYVAFTRPGVATTTGAESISATGATLDGQVAPNGSDAKWYFQYEAHGATGWTATKVSDAGSGAQPVSVSLAVTGLKSATSYSYRLIVVNAFGASVGSTKTLSTS